MDRQRAFFDPVDFGELTVGPLAMWWKGRRVDATPMHREIVLHLLQLEGRVMSWRALARALHIASINEKGYGDVRSYVSRTRARFYRVDPDFTQLETVKGQGFRWKQ